MDCRNKSERRDVRSGLPYTSSQQISQLNRFIPLVWGFPRVLLYPFSFHYQHHLDLLDRFHPALSLPITRLYLGASLRFRSSQTTHRLRWLAIRLQSHDGFHLNTVLPDPTLPWIRSRSSYGHHIQPKRVDLEPSFWTFEVEIFGVRMHGGRQLARRDNLPGVVEISSASIGICLGYADQ